MSLQWVEKVGNGRTAGKASRRPNKRVKSRLLLFSGKASTPELHLGKLALASRRCQSSRGRCRESEYGRAFPDV